MKENIAKPFAKKKKNAQTRKVSIFDNLYSDVIVVMA